ncbi:MAG: hypothetical protein E4H13_14770 [Calditrichales bacterium]|nr:MAG: hypothetical protein E4H13_14770 [Calditrichales bacterium]
MSEFKILLINPKDRRQTRKFNSLPFQLYRHNSQWVPPLAIEARSVFDTERRAIFRHGEVAFLLAINSSNQAVGRLAVIHNRSYNQFNHEKTAFFYLFECVDDRRVSKELFDFAFQWAGEQGLQQVVGPKGFTPLDGMGLLVKGFEHRPAFGQPYNLPYYPQLLELSGFLPDGDMVSGYLNVRTMDFTEKIKQVAEKVQERRGIKVVQFRNRRDFARSIPAFQDLYNASLDGTSGTMPLSSADIKTLADQLLWFANPKLIKILMKEEQLIGFLLAYPDISAAVQRNRGRLFPFGWLDILLEMKRTRWVNINGAAIVEKYRGLGGTAILFNEMYKSISSGTFEHADLVQIGTDNEKMQLELRGLGIDFYKTHRIYRKVLN